MACGTGVISFNRWGGTRDKDGHRQYWIVWLVRTDESIALLDGPHNALYSVGMPQPGSLWNFGNDFDIDAVCSYEAEMTSKTDDGERNKYFEVKQIFKTNPADKCINRTGTGTGTGNPATDPLGEPPILSGRFVKYTEEKTIDRFGNNIEFSSHERIRGPIVEFDASRLTVNVQMNEAVLDLPTKILLVDTVNANAMWGFDARKVKLSNISWEQKYTGNCDCYYTVIYEFEISPEGFDRLVLDEGTKALNGKWNKTTGVWELVNINGNPPDVNNPTHFIRITDFYDNPIRVVLNGAGIPAVNVNGTGVSDPGRISIEYYTENDFLLSITGLPDSLECVA